MRVVSLLSAFLLLSSVTILHELVPLVRKVCLVSDSLEDVSLISVQKQLIDDWSNPKLELVPVSWHTSIVL